MPDMSSRKRTVAPRDEGDPATFLEEYFRERGLTGRQDSDASLEVQQRAEQARERFKQLRTEAAKDSSNSAAASKDTAAAVATGLDADTLTKEQKYNRRLANNRKSAAASRVYNEVLRKETEFTLKEVVERAKRYEVQIESMTKEMRKLADENSSLKAKLQKLESATSEDPPSPVTTAPPPEKKQRTGPSSFTEVPSLPTLPKNSTALPTLLRDPVRIPQSVPLSNDIGACPSLFNASQGSDDGFNAMLRLSQSQSQEDDDEKPQTLQRLPSLAPCLTNTGVFGGSQELPNHVRYSLGSQDPVGNRPFTLGSQDNTQLRLGSQEPRIQTQDIVGADEEPRQTVEEGTAVAAQ